MPDQKIHVYSVFIPENDTSVFYGEFIREFCIPPVITDTIEIDEAAHLINLIKKSNTQNDGIRFANPVIL